MKLTLRKVAICFAVVVAGALACVWGGYVWITSEGGLRFVKNQVNEIAGVQVGDVRRDGRNIVFDDIALNDDVGVYLRIGQAGVSVRLWPLLSGVASLPTLWVQDTEWLRHAQFASVDEGEQSGGWMPIHAVRVDALALKNIRISKAVAGGDVRLDGGGYVHVDLHDWTHSRLDLDVMRDGAGFVSLRLDDEGFAASVIDDGLIMRLAGMDDAKAITIKGMGGVDGGGVWRGAIAGSVQDMAVVDMQMQGVGHEQFAVNGVIAGEVLGDASVTMRLNTDKYLRKIHTNLKYGDDIALQGTLNRKQLRMGMRDLVVVTPYAHVGGRVWFNANNSRIGADLVASQLDQMMVGVGGEPSVSAKIRGTVSPLNVRVGVDGVVKDFAYDNDVVMELIGKNPNIKGNIVVTDAGVNIESLRISGGRASASAKGWLRDFDALDIEYQLSAQPNEGRVDIVGHAQGGLDAPNVTGELGGTYSGVDVKAKYAFLADVLSLTDLGVRFEGGRAFGTATLNVADGTSQTRLEIEPEGSDAIALTVKGQVWSKLDIEARSVGALPLHVLVKGDVGASPMSMKVHALRVMENDMAFVLKRPFDVEYDASVVRMSPAQFGFLGGVVNLAADMRVDDMSGQIQGDFADIRLANGRVRMAGDLAVSMANGVADMRVGMRQGQNHSLQILAQTGMRAGASITGSVTGDLNLAILGVLPAMDGHNLGGVLNADMHLSGVNTLPEIAGRLSVRNGTYSNVEYGTKLSDVQVDVGFAGNRFDIRHAKALDGKGGTLSVSGSGRIDGSTGQFDFNSQNMLLASTPRLSMTVSGDGAVRLLDKGGEVQARVNVEKAEVYVSDMLGIGDPYKGFVIIDDQAPQVPVQGGGAALALDVTLSAHGGVFVRGPGLDSEWGMNLRIGGDTQNPDVRGDVFVVRGRYEFVDLVAQLKPESKAIFTGGVDVSNPELEISGDIRGNGHVAVLNVTGTANAPKVAISSPDGLPADEALAYVMFGEAKGSLSAGQMFRIARVLSALSGRGTGFDPLNAIRRNMGLDSLSVGMDDEGGASVSAGKYLSDGVYVSVEQGTSPTSTAVKTEVELTESIRLETKVTPVDNSVGVQWRRDY